MQAETPPPLPIRRPRQSSRQVTPPRRAHRPPNAVHAHVPRQRQHTPAFWVPPRQPSDADGLAPQHLPSPPQQDAQEVIALMHAHAGALLQSADAPADPRSRRQTASVPLHQPEPLDNLGLPIGGAAVFVPAATAQTRGGDAAAGAAGSHIDAALKNDIAIFLHGASRAHVGGSAGSPASARDAALGSSHGPGASPAAQSAQHPSASQAVPASGATAAGPGGDPVRGAQPVSSDTARGVAAARFGGAGRATHALSGSPAQHQGSPGPGAFPLSPQQRAAFAAGSPADPVAGAGLMHSPMPRNSNGSTGGFVESRAAGGLGGLGAPAAAPQPSMSMQGGHAGAHASSTGRTASTAPATATQHAAVPDHGVQRIQASIAVPPPRSLDVHSSLAAEPFPSFKAIPGLRATVQAQESTTAHHGAASASGLRKPGTGRSPGGVPVTSSTARSAPAAPHQAADHASLPRWLTGVSPTRTPSLRAEQQAAQRDEGTPHRQAPPPPAPSSAREHAQAAGSPLTRSYLLREQASGVRSTGYMRSDWMHPVAAPSQPGAAAPETYRSRPSAPTEPASRRRTASSPNSPGATAMQSATAMLLGANPSTRATAPMPSAAAAPRAIPSESHRRSPGRAALSTEARQPWRESPSEQNGYERVCCRS